MPADEYQKMAADAKAALNKRTADQESERQAVSDERKKYVAKAASPLREDVLPALNKAAVEFKNEDIDSKIESDLDVESYVSRDPLVKFQCLGPRRRKDGWQFEARPIFISSDGYRMKLGTGKHGFSREADQIIAEENVDNYGELVRIGLETALKFYTEAYEENRHAF
jgi:hypothetical protein